MIKAKKFEFEGKTSVAVKTRGKLEDLLKEFSAIVISFKDSNIEDEMVLKAFIEGFKNTSYKRKNTTELMQFLNEDEDGGYEIDI